MSKVIFKYVLDITDRQTVLLPKYSKILTVQMQNGEACIWVLCDLNQPYMSRIIKCYGTGNTIPDSLDLYLGTIQSNGGGLVWHFFDAGDLIQ